MLIYIPDEIELWMEFFKELVNSQCINKSFFEIKLNKNNAIIIYARHISKI